ncbi:hypothetical protein DRH29_06055 [candidate division Kazan bacterium]|uniref:Uncharacterized protein n=1 Tax=candidate division Kazan bacterium TaxID=2202143 RepID=A0A420ZAI1_UNCK3|nr:MAG: hypothetical protein DRH29_06055 [candidate division Kazan bacterium]
MFKLAMWTVEIWNKLIDWWHKLIRKLTYRYYKDFTLKCPKCGRLLEIIPTAIYYKQEKHKECIILVCWCGYNAVYMYNNNIKDTFGKDIVLFVENEKKHN